MLTREEIRSALAGENTSCKLSIREALETALYLYDEVERLKGECVKSLNVYYDENNVMCSVADALRKLSGDCEGWKKKYLDRLTMHTEAVEENARLREVVDAAKYLWDRECYECDGCEAGPKMGAALDALGGEK